ncbi:MAG: hypothetical protein QM796_08785 [Chthoniobacteraceae bacterium]
MRRTRASSIYTTLLAWLVCVAWVFAVNHCAIAEVLKMTMKPVTTDSCPYCHSQSAPKAPATPMPECCKSLHATPATPAEVNLAINPLVESTLDLVQAFRCIETGHPFSLTADTGPPRPVAFRELLLTRCHPGIAPPMLS